MSMDAASENSHIRVGPAEEDDNVVEVDPSGRFLRYQEVVGTGRFKMVYRAYDTENGIDVAWSKINGLDKDITLEKLHEICNEMQKGNLKVKFNKFNVDA